MSYLPHVLAILIGAGPTVQVGMNATVRDMLGSAAIATIVNFLVGLTAAAFLALTLVAQMVAALIVDHYSAIGFPAQPVTVWRVIGVVLLVVGVLLIMRR
jgi:bacterial/archaeal transporter family-2 protein